MQITKYKSKNNGNNTLSKQIKQIYSLLEMRLGDRLKKILCLHSKIKWFAIVNSLVGKLF